MQKAGDLEKLFAVMGTCTVDLNPNLEKLPTSRVCTCRTCSVFMGKGSVLLK